MRTKLFTIIMVLPIFVGTLSFAQERQKDNPYAALGHTPFVVGAEKQSGNVFVIENFEEGSVVGKLEHNPLTGEVKLFDRAGNFINEVRLSEEERAFLSIDPRAEKYYGISPYAYANNNPVRYIDPNGMEFTDAAQAWVDRLLTQVNGRITRNAEAIASRQTQLANGGLSAKQTQRLERQIARYESSNVELNAITSEINVLTASSQMYDVRTDNTLSSAGTTIAGIQYNWGNDNIEMLMPSSGGGLNLFSHELKHAYQFETGNINLGDPNSSNRNSFNLFFDKHDELEAYNRGAMFGGDRYHNSGSLPSIYNRYPEGPIDVTNHLEASRFMNIPAGLQNLSIQTNSVFRHNGTTYRPR